MTLSVLSVRLYTKMALDNSTHSLSTFALLRDILHATNKGVVYRCLAGAHLSAWPGRYCSPCHRHISHCEPSCLELKVIL